MKFFTVLAVISGTLGAKVQYSHHVGHLSANEPCIVGWLRNKSTGNCDDYDECAARNHTCGTHPCVNTPGSYQCMCGPGYVGTLPYCHDIDECKIGNHTCKNNISGVMCHNTKGSFECRCKSGWTGLHYVGAVNLATCRNENECTAGTSRCSPNATCTDSHGSYFCKCNDGWAGNGINCYDVDECQRGSCHWKHGSVCNNTIGSYTCNCGQGYTEANGKCNSINECTNSSLHNCNAAASCIDTEGSFWCRCNNGYAGDGINCTDIDECASHPCAKISPLFHAATCNNTPGSYQCVCNPGFEPDTAAPGTCKNINECANSSLHNCYANASTCMDTMGSFLCQCLTGFHFNFTIRNCGDIDECNGTLHSCVQQGQGCNNTFGSFQCMCRPGFQEASTLLLQTDSIAEFVQVGSEVHRSRSQSTEGFASEGVTNQSLMCANVDECTAGTHNCHATLGKCTDSFGSFSCECNGGYIGDGVECVTYDLCFFKHDSCDTNARCNATNGSFTCTCNAGYTGNGTNCTDTDECGIYHPENNSFTNTSHNCHADHGLCSNSEGSFVCSCKPGYLGTGEDCMDIDECALGLGQCPGNASCTNTAGSFQCDCNAGWRMRNRTHPYNLHWDCVERDECAENALARRANSSVPTLCDGNSTCHNSVGSYICRCPWGYSHSKDHWNCTDNDECKAGTHNCSQMAYCQNTIGNYTCRCHNGYNGSGYGQNGCTDIDECRDGNGIIPMAENRSLCTVGAHCNNTVGSYTCTCDAGYFGDGVNCLNKDECRLKIHNCNADHLCRDTVGSFTCQCPLGYADMNKKANGTHCVSNKTIEIGQFKKTNIRRGGSTLDWQRVKFTSPFFKVPIVIATLPLMASREVSARVRGVTRFKFEVAISYPMSSSKEADDEFFKFINSTVKLMNFIAVAKGNYTLPDGTILNADEVLPCCQNKRTTPCSPQDDPPLWQPMTFARNMSSRPVLLVGFQGTPGLDDPSIPADFRGGPMSKFCVPGIRYDSTKNHTIQVTRICHNSEPGAYKGSVSIGYIAIGSNVSNATLRSTQFSVLLPDDNRQNKTIDYKLLDTFDSPLTSATPGQSTEQVIQHNSSIANPIAFASKVTMDENYVGWFNLEGSNVDNTTIRLKEDKCAVAPPRREFFTAFVASEVFSV